MESERLTFLAAIDAAPHDEAPKKVYADWLDEHNEPKAAAFMRAWAADNFYVQITFEGRSLCRPRKVKLNSEGRYSVTFTGLRMFQAVTHVVFRILGQPELSWPVRLKTEEGRVLVAADGTFTTTGRLL